MKDGVSKCGSWLYSTMSASGPSGTIDPALADLGGVDSARDGARIAKETRPRNMKAVFIVRIA